MLIGSSVLSIIGTIYTISFQVNNFLPHESLFEYNFVSRNTMIFFASTNFMDLIIGSIYYPKYMYPLTTYFHHFAFLMTSFVVIGQGKCNGFVGTFVFEIPTFLLCLGTIWEGLRLDLIYGLVFFICRILLNIYWVFRTKIAEEAIGDHYIWWKVLLGPLTLHLLWFSQWVKGALKRHSSSKSTPDGMSSEKEAKKAQ